MGKITDKKYLAFVANVREGISEAVSLPHSDDTIDSDNIVFVRRPLGNQNFLSVMTVLPTLPTEGYTNETSKRNELAKLVLSQKIDAAGGLRSKKIVISSGGEVKESESILPTAYSNLGPGRKIQFQNLTSGTYKDVPLPLEKSIGGGRGFSDSSHFYEHLATY